MIVGQRVIHRIKLESTTALDAYLGLLLVRVYGISWEFRDSAYLRGRMFVCSEIIMKIEFQGIEWIVNLVNIVYLESWMQKGLKKKNWK